MNTTDFKEAIVTNELEGIDEEFVTEILKPLPSDEPTAPKIHITSSYTIDDRGLLNNYAIMPLMYVEEEAPTITRKHIQKQIMLSLFIIAIALLIALLLPSQ